MFSSWNIRFWEYDFFAKEWLWLLILIIPIAYFLFRQENKRLGDWKYSRPIKDQKKIASNWISQLRSLMILTTLFAFSLITIALAKPYSWNNADNFDRDYKNGIDIILAMDVSLSMLAMDFKPNRLEASKKVAEKFVSGRKGDRIGLVVYAGEAYTACPATLDYEILKQQIKSINGDKITGGTAIGTGLGTAVTRLRSDSLKSKVIILLTDGSNNMGELTPEMAAELAKSKNIRVYTIGVGSKGTAKSPVITPFGVQFQTLPVQIDEETLKRIAQTTDGEYFRATDEKSLENIYKEIEKLEKRKMEDKHFKSQPPTNPQAFLNWAFLILFINWSVKQLLFKND